MLLTIGALAVISLNALAVVAQSATQWCDNITGACFQRFYDPATDSGWGYLFPSTPNAEFIGIFTSRLNTGWMGASLGGGMRSNPLVVGWVDGSRPVMTVRYTTQYGLPPVMNNPPTITVLGTSGTNSTHQRIVYRCQNCGTWSGGSINFNGDHIFGYAIHDSIKPVSPANPGSSLTRHTVAAQHNCNTVSGRSTTYATQLERFINSPPLGQLPSSSSVPPPPPSSTLPPPSSTVPPPSSTLPPPSSSRPPSSTVAPPPSSTIPNPPPPTGTIVPLWGQCGGRGYTGPTTCVANAICFVHNVFHHQCIPR